MMRRWISIARWSSISCSVIAPSSVSHGSGWRRTRNRRLVRTARPITGSSRKRSQNGRRSSSTLVAKRIRAMPARAAGFGRRAGGEQHAVGRGLDDADQHRLAADPQQPLERRAAAAQQPVHRGAAELERPRRPDLLADFDARHRAQPA